VFADRHTPPYKAAGAVVVFSPRVNAHGGPEGRPGCWQKVTKFLWPFPYLVTDTGYSVAPYNHFEIATPWTSDYIWGRQVGETTINP
jgi:phospholipid/cholesterol/gamma-HCH transport system substrate-binding protein